jgi:hypothetical protein
MLYVSNSLKFHMSIKMSQRQSRVQGRTKSLALKFMQPVDLG